MYGTLGIVLLQRLAAFSQFCESIVSVDSFFVTCQEIVFQLFALGYHQSRWNYNDQEDVRKVDAGFEEHDIPYDVLWLDIEHSDGKRYFTWDSQKFPDSVAMINNIASKGRKMVTITDPHIKRSSGYHVYDEGTSKSYFVKNKDGGEFDGWCWPGSSSYTDYVNPEVHFILH